MQYDKLDDKTPIQGSAIRQSSVNDFKQNKEIKKARIIILVLLSVELIFAVFYLVEQCIRLGQYYDEPATAHTSTLGASLIGNVVVATISVIYLIVFLIVVAKYIRLGILVFAWLSIIQLICVLIVFILSIIAVATIANNKAQYSYNAGLALSIVIIILSFLSCVFTVLVIVYSFKLAKLIKQQEVYQHV